MPQVPTLSLRHVTKRFANADSPTLSDISFELARGDLLGILGPSGCGKTTLLRVIAGFEKPEAGTLKVGDQVVVGPKCWIPPEQRGIGLVFQDYALFPHLTVMDNILFGLKQQEKARTQGSLSRCQARAREVLELVDLAGFEVRFPHELSGGQQQRVALARALAPRPSLILLDEPLSNLDAQVRHYLRDEIRTILKETETTAIFVTHDQQEALAISDWVAVMHQGHVEQLGQPEDIYRQPASRFVAEFVTQANFLPAQRRDHQWLTEVGSFAAHGEAATVERGELMIRQEDLKLEPDPEGSVVVRQCQFLGREYRYCLIAESGRELHARSFTKFPIGSRVRLGAVGQQYRVFGVPA